MRIVLVGVSHKTAPVHLREKLSLYGEPVGPLLHALRDSTGLEEVVLLSTCNRTEVCALTRQEEWQEQLLDFFAARAGVREAQLQDHVFGYEGTPAVRHLFRVAGGLDSMVLGEGQILSQVKEAFQEAQHAGTAGPVLHALFRQAITCGKRVRTETGIGQGAVSVSQEAVKLARSVWGRLDHRTVLLLGAGETGEQTARMLLSGGSGPRLLVCNRTPERARELADAFGGSAVPFEELTDALVRTDIAICSTGAPHALITADQMRRVMRGRRGRSLLLIDIAVPRDVDPAVQELDDVYLYNIDDLQEQIARNMAGREAEAERAQELVEEEVQRFQQWLRGLEVAPTIGQLTRWAEEVVQAERQRVGGRLSHLSERDRDAVEILVRGVVGKLLHPPIRHLRRAAGSGNGFHEVEHVRAIFGLDETDAGEEEG